MEAGYSLVVLDNFANSSPESLRRVRLLAGPGAAERLRVIEGDIRSRSDLDQAFGMAHPAQLGGDVPRWLGVAPRQSLWLCGGAAGEPVAERAAG